VWGSIFTNMKFIIQLFSIAVVVFTACQKEEERPSGEPPVSDFIYQVETNNTRKVNFAATAAGADFYTWDFGDNLGRSFSASTNYEYLKNGTYTVALTVSNRFGVHTKYVTIDITGPLPIEAGFEVNFDNIPNNLRVNLTNTSKEAASYRWDFGDGNSTTVANPGGHNYAQSGLYEITLEAKDANGNVKDRQRTKVQVFDERHLFGNANSATWRFRTTEVNNLSAYYTIQNGDVAFDNTLLDCELNDRYTFINSGVYSNANQADGRLFSQGGECRMIATPNNSDWKLLRRDLLTFELEIGNNYLGDAESRSVYRMRTLTANVLSVSIEKLNANTGLKDVIVMDFVPE
jgi:PKD domain